MGPEILSQELSDNVDAFGPPINRLAKKKKKKCGKITSEMLSINGPGHIT